MFGLIMLFGLLLMIVALGFLGGATYLVAKRLGARARFAVGLAICAVVAPVAALNAGDIYAAHRYNDICRSSGRHIQAVAKDVDGVRLVESNDDGLGDGQSVSSWLVFRRYGFIEWSNGSLKWRRNGRSGEICGVGAACNLKSFAARYELRVRNSAVSSRITTREKQIIDTKTGQVLGSENTVYMARPSALTWSNLLLVAWRLPQELFDKPDDACLSVDEERFVSDVLGPA